MPFATGGAPAGDDRRLSPGLWHALLPLLPWLLLVLVLGFLVFRHFLLIFTVAASAALLLSPAQNRFTRALGGRSAIAAGVLTAACALLIIVPILSYAALMRDQVVAFVEWVRPNLEPNALRQLWRETLRTRLPLLGAWIDPHGNADVMAVASEALSRVVVVANQVAQNLLAGLASAILDVVLFLMMVFFLLRDGGKLRQELRSISPLSDAQEGEIFTHLTRTVNGVLVAMLAVPLAQGVLALVGFLIFGVPAPLVWSVVVVFAAMIPLVGSPLGWVPAGVYLLMTGAVGRGVGLLVYGTLVISTIDNILKPIILQSAARIHTLLGFLSILGGLLAFGPMGIVAGPVVLSLLLSAFRIYRDDVLRWARQPVATLPEESIVETSPTPAGEMELTR
jgi:predicted PurR-regulated permease PerM